MTERDPFLEEALERYQPPVSGGADWADVTRRARSGRGRGQLAWKSARIALGATGAAAIIGLFALLIIQGPSTEQAAGRVGDPAPAVSFPIVYPDPTYGIVAPTTALADLRGQVVVLAFINDACVATSSDNKVQRLRDEVQRLRERLQGSQSSADTASLRNELRRLRAQAGAAQPQECAAAADVLSATRLSSATSLAVVSGVPTDEARRFATGPITVTAPPAAPSQPSGTSASAAVVVPSKAYRGLATASDPDGSSARAFGVERLPTIIVIDRRGRIARRYEQMPSAEALGTYLERLARQAPPRDLPPAPPVEPTLAVFSDPSTLWNGTPPRSIACPYVADSFHVAARGGNGEVLLLGQGLGRSLVTIARGGAGGGSIGCGAPRTEAARQRALRQAHARGFLTLTTGSSGGRFSLAIVVLDGYDRIVIDGVEWPVKHNGFIGSFKMKPRSVVIKGPAGQRRVHLMTRW